MESKRLGSFGGRGRRLIIRVFLPFAFLPTFSKVHLLQCLLVLHSDQQLKVSVDVRIALRSADHPVLIIRRFHWLTVARQFRFFGRFGKRAPQLGVEPAYDCLRGQCQQHGSQILLRNQIAAAQIEYIKYHSVLALRPSPQVLVIEQ